MTNMLKVNLKSNSSKKKEKRKYSILTNTGLLVFFFFGEYGLVSLTWQIERLY